MFSRLLLLDVSPGNGDCLVFKDVNVSIFLAYDRTKRHSASSNSQSMSFRTWLYTEVVLIHFNDHELLVSAMKKVSESLWALMQYVGNVLQCALP